MGDKCSDGQGKEGIYNDQIPYMINDSRGRRWIRVDSKSKLKSSRPGFVVNGERSRRCIIPSALDPGLKMMGHSEVSGTVGVSQMANQSAEGSTRPGASTSDALCTYPVHTRLDQHMMISGRGADPNALEHA